MAFYPPVEELDITLGEKNQRKNLGRLVKVYTCMRHQSKQVICRCFCNFPAISKKLTETDIAGLQ
jgi:hypothetical protein